MRGTANEEDTMVIVTICVGSSCHIYGSEEIVNLLNQAIEKYGLDGEVIPVGGFCTEKCNRKGVTIQVDDDFFTGVTPATFDTFFTEHILSRVEKEG
jgi:NADH:ubiquinone oxidoreductase subunit E